MYQIKYYCKSTAHQYNDALIETSCWETFQEILKNSSLNNITK